MARMYWRTHNLWKDISEQEVFFKTFQYNYFVKQKHQIELNVLFWLPGLQTAPLPFNTSLLYFFFKSPKNQFLSFQINSLNSLGEAIFPNLKQSTNDFITSPCLNFLHIICFFSGFFLSLFYLQNKEVLFYKSCSNKLCKNRDLPFVCFHHFTNKRSTKQVHKCLC